MSLQFFSFNMFRGLNMYGYIGFGQWLQFELHASGALKYFFIKNHDLYKASLRYLTSNVIYTIFFIIYSFRIVGLSNIIVSHLNLPLNLLFNFFYIKKREIKHVVSVLHPHKNIIFFYLLLTKLDFCKKFYEFFL